MSGRPSPSKSRAATAPPIVLGVSAPTLEPLSWAKASPDTRVTSVNPAAGTEPEREATGKISEKRTPMSIAAIASTESTGQSGEIAVGTSALVS